MTLAFSGLPVALPPGCAGVQLEVADVVALLASPSEPAGGADPALLVLPESLRGAVLSRRADYLAGRLAAQEAVRLVSGEATPVGRDDDGSPRWPDGLEGSISHHGGLACAVARPASGGIGVDLAPLLEGSSLRAVWRRCLGEEERSRWEAPEAATIAFAAKECLFKAAHGRVQRFIGFDEAEIMTIEAARSAVEMCHPVDVSDRRTEAELSGPRPDEAPDRRMLAGTWTAVLADDLARLLGTATVTGAYAWEGGRLFAVVALSA